MRGVDFNNSQETEPMKRSTLMLAVAACAAVSALPAHAQQQKMALTLDSAKKMAAACEARAKQEGWKMIIAIMDDGGNLKHLSRMDGAFLGSLQIAQLKANTSASFPFSTRQVGEIAQQRVPGIAYVPGIVTCMVLSRESRTPFMRTDRRHGIRGRFADAAGGTLS